MREAFINRIEFVATGDANDLMFQRSLAEYFSVVFVILVQIDGGIDIRILRIGE
jgi:hypothetical protein